MLSKLPDLKSAIDVHLTTKRATEREFQQLVAWENNRSTIANETEYFITDIEYADPEFDTRIDMLGVRWRGHERQKERALVPVLFEMKYGNKALNGSSGIIDHFFAIAGLLKSKEQIIRETIKRQFSNLRSLGLLKYNESARAANPGFAEAKPEVIFLLANYNPRSSALVKILSDLLKLEESHSQFDLRFFVAAFAGYGMHHACMLSTRELLQAIDRFPTGRPED
jgi:hypothetical protein